MRILICDDHRLVADALALVFRMAGHDVVAIVEMPSEADAVLSREVVDVCIIDLWYGYFYGLDAVSAIAQRYPAMRTVVLSGHLDRERIDALRRAGADSWAMKGGRIEDVVRLVENQGESVVADGFDRWQRDVLARFLTSREREVLEGIAAGDSTPVLAYRLGVSNATLRTHIQSILTKLGVHSRLEAVSYAVSRGLIVPERHARRREMSS